jgi:hypothetical protein
MSLMYQYAGTVEYNKTHIKTIENNTRSLMKSDTWNSFINHVGKNMTDDMFHLFRQYNNSTLLIFLGDIDISSKLSFSEIRDKLNRVHKNRIYADCLTVDALWNSGGKEESKRRFYKRQQDFMFHKFLSNLKQYNRHLFEWKMRDVLNNPNPSVSSKSRSVKMDVDVSSPKFTRKRSLDKSSVRESSIRESLLYESSRKRPTVRAGGRRKTSRKTRRKTRRNRK